MSTQDVDGAAPSHDDSQPALKRGAVGFLSNLTMGMASAAPGYSAALTIGLLAGVTGMGFQSPAILIVSFIPLFLTAGAYRTLNAEMPDSGTTFAWAARAVGPHTGWIGGWALLVAYACVQGITSSIAAKYFFLMVGWSSAAESTWACTGVGLFVIAITMVLCLVGIDISARAQRWLLYVELLTLGLFVVVALFQAFRGDADTVTPSLSWLNPFAISSWSAVAGGILLGVFMYWGWETSVTVAEESKHSRSAPGRAAVLSVVGLVLLYVVITTAAQSVRGPDFLAGQSDDVLSATAQIALGEPWDRALFFSVCSSAVAASLTALITTSRTMYSMSRARALPRSIESVHPRWRTPWVATMIFAAVASSYFVIMTAVSPNFLQDSVIAIGLLVLFYYALTAFACAFYFRNKWRNGFRAAWNCIVAPALGALMLTAVLIKAAIDYGKSDAGKLTGFAGIGSPLLIATGALVIGAVVMLLVKRADPTFFQQHRDKSGPLEPVGDVED